MTFHCTGHDSSRQVGLGRTGAHAKLTSSYPFISLAGDLKKVRPREEQKERSVERRGERSGGMKDTRVECSSG